MTLEPNPQEAEALAQQGEGQGEEQGEGQAEEQGEGQAEGQGEGQGEEAPAQAGWVPNMAVPTAAPSLSQLFHMSEMAMLDPTSIYLTPSINMAEHLPGDMSIDHSDVGVNTIHIPTSTE